AHAANDDFLVIARPPDPPDDERSLPHLFLTRGEGGGDSLRYRHFPLFSTVLPPEDSADLVVPAADPLLGDDTASLRPLPWADPLPVAWVPITDRQGRVTGRHAWWVEDLQGKLDARSAGNTEGPDGAHARNAWPFPAPGLNPEPPAAGRPKLDRIAFHVLDPASGDRPEGDLTRRVIDGRDRMLSPGSLLAAAGYQAPLPRGEDSLPVDPVAAALEKHACPVLRPYPERPTVPFAAGISAAAAGRPKLNLNRLLARDRRGAIDDFADWIDLALPDFAT